MVNALKSKPALAASDVLNKPERTLQTGYDSNKCFDASRLANSGAGYSNKNEPTKKLIPIKNISDLSIFWAQQLTVRTQRPPLTLDPGQNLIKQILMLSLITTKASVWHLLEGSPMELLISTKCTPTLMEDNGIEIPMLPSR